MCLGWEGPGWEWWFSDHDHWESVEGGELNCGEETVVMGSMGLWTVGLVGCVTFRSLKRETLPCPAQRKYGPTLS